MRKPEQIAAELFEEALDLRPEQRPAFLDSACAEMPELRRTVESLLRDRDRVSGCHAETNFFVAKDSSPTASVQGNILEAGTMLGRYSIVEPLGSGGMGVVYRARDEQLERTVAIKLLASGALIGEEARRHFRREALALAKLNHPHIAAVYDVGQQDGIDTS